ncbi:MAG: peroxiredoxin, partial [Halothiobacillaceae bacterium]
DTSTVRAVFVIDPDGMLRAMMYYPMTIGRSIDEVVRTVQALQMVHRHGVATPADWHPGHPVIVPPPANRREADQRRQSSDHQCVDWYWCVQDAPRDA